MPYSALRYVTDIRTSRCGLWITAEVSFAATIICDHIDMAVRRSGGLGDYLTGKFVFVQSCCSLLVLIPISWCHLSLFAMSIQTSASDGKDLAWTLCVAHAHILLSLYVSMLDISWYFLTIAVTPKISYLKATNCWRSWCSANRLQRCSPSPSSVFQSPIPCTSHNSDFAGPFRQVVYGLFMFIILTYLDLCSFYAWKVVVYRRIDVYLQSIICVCNCICI